MWVMMWGSIQPTPGVLYASMWWFVSGSWSCVTLSKAVLTHARCCSSVAVRYHPALQMVGGSIVCRIHDIQWWERDSQAVCAWIQTGRILGHFGCSESGVATTTVGGHILQSSAESLGPKDNKGTWGRKVKECLQSQHGFESQEEC